MSYLSYTALVWIGISVLYLICVKYQKKKIRTGILQVLLLPVLTFVCAKVLYMILQFSRVWGRYGIEFLWKLQPELFSFAGGCIGGCLAIFAGAKLTGGSGRQYADLFAPFGALAVVLFRLAEGLFMNETWDLGLGNWLEDETLAFFPLSIQVDGDWFFAVFLWSAILSLGVAIYGFLQIFKEHKPGFVFRKVVFGLALVQILPESLRALSIRWGFVRAEQVLCAVLVFSLLLFSVINGKWPRAQKWLMPSASLIGFGVAVWVEFALDKSDIHSAILYGIMFLTLVGQTLLARCAFRREQNIGS